MVSPTRPSLKDRVNAAAKGVFGGVAGALISVLFTTVTDPDSALNPDAVDTGSNPPISLPNTTAEWVTLLVAVALGFLLPWAKRNYPSVADAAKQLEIARVRVDEGKQQA